ncbi:hypothetical protein [Streptosporangium sp. NPDC000396]|uniref:hypothetical protein n=1 Tax=Streptosporangium sp. NPDC000396 TaxID=3366185 RepID=UPI0036A184A2
MRGHDRVRELMVRHNPVPPHEVGRRVLGPEEEEVLRRILCGDAPSRARRRRPAALAAALGAVATVLISVHVPSGDRRAPAPATAALSPPGLAGRVGPEILEDLARITHISNTEPLPDPSPRPMSSFPQASPKLLELAALAAARPRPPAGPWSYVATEEWLMSTTVETGGAASRVVPWLVQRWTPVSGKGTCRRVRTAGRPFEGGGWEGIPPEAGRSIPAPSREEGRVADLRPRANALSRSGPVLRDQLLGTEPQVTMTRTRRLVRAVENLHSHDVVEPALTAVLWRVLAAQDDLRSLGQVRDRRGRPGQAFGFEDGPLLGVLVVSSATGGLLATELIRVARTRGHEIRRPVVEEYRTYVIGRWVGGVGETS